MESGTILAAVISAAVASIGVTLAKDGKVSEFRQQWIDGLRDDVATYIALLVRKYQIKKAQREKTYAYAVGDEAVSERANMALYRIVLRLDIKQHKDESKNKKLHHKLYTVVINARTVATATPRVLEEDVTNAMKAVESATMAVLDESWERVKSGETTFRYVRYIAYGALGLSLVLLGALGTLNWYHRNDASITRFEVTKPVTVDLHQPQTIQLPINPSPVVPSTSTR
jgi:hypothetical protein